MTADDVIRLLNLQPHPIEGGHFRETYRGPASTAIYYLLTPGTVSEMHRLPGDEVFHFYLGGPVRMLQLHPDGTGKQFTLGTDLLAGEVPQLVVPGGVWQGSRLVSETGFALLGATVAPPFEYAHYETGRRADLSAAWPDWAAEITKLTPRG